MKLNFAVAPEVSTKAALIGAVENRPVILVCTANAYPKAMVEWMRYGNTKIIITYSIQS